MTITLTSESDDDDLTDMIKEYYGGEDGKDQIDYITAYFLTTMKPETRAFSADAKTVYMLNGEEINSTEMTYKEAKDYIENLEDEQEDADDVDGADEDASEDAADAAEDVAEDVAEGADED